MTGLKTILALLVSAFAVPFFAKYAVTLTPDQQAELVAGGVAAVGIVMRFFTNGPALEGLKTILAQRSKSGTPDASALADAVIAEIRRRQAAVKAAAPAPAAAEPPDHHPV